MFRSTILIFGLLVRPHRLRMERPYVNFLSYLSTFTTYVNGVFSSLVPTPLYLVLCGDKRMFGPLS